MAIEPISLSGLSRNPVGIEAVLARGGSALQGILQTAAQVGRDQANNQARQERDFLTEQRREINLTQRRGELRQQDAEDTRTFDEGVRRFDNTFGEGTRQFDTRIEQANLDRVRTDRGLDLRETQGTAEIDLAKKRLENDTSRLANEKEDVIARREDRKLNREYDSTRLDMAKQQLNNAKTEDERAKAKADHEGALNEARSKILTRMDDLLQSGDTAGATSLFRTHVEDPNYEIPDSTRSRFARTLGIDKQGSSAGPEGARPLEDLTLDDINAELTTLTSATGTGGLTAKEPTEKTAIRIADLKRKKAELELKTEGGRTSAADRLLRLGRQNR